MIYLHLLMQIGQGIPYVHPNWKHVWDLLQHYVFWSSVLVNILAGCELVCRTVEQWAIDSATDFPILGRFGIKLRTVEKAIAVITDLVDRLGAINFKNVLRPRQNRRVNDTETLTPTSPEPPASKGTAAGS